MVEITFTDSARKQVKAFIGQEGDDDVLRIASQGSPLAPQYEISLVGEADRNPGDHVIDEGEFKIFVDQQSARLVDGAIIDWVETLQGGGFKFESPNTAPMGAEPPSGPLAERVQQIIESQVNPAVAMHGGRVSLVDVRDAVAFVELGGGCQGCGMATVTLRHGVETMIKQAVPEIEEVRDVTNHAGGTNPYFQERK